MDCSQCGKPVENFEHLSGHSPETLASHAGEVGSVEGSIESMRAASASWNDREEQPMSGLSSVAETYLRMLPNTEGNRHERMYVRLAYKYKVPFGRIVALSGLSAEVVAAHLEGND